MYAEDKKNYKKRKHAYRKKRGIKDAHKIY